MPWKRIAVQSQNGQICVNIKREEGPKSPQYDRVWLHDEKYKFETRTLHLTRELDLTCHVFKFGSPIDPGADAPVVEKPYVFWNMRDLKAGLCIDYGEPKFHIDWPARNFNNLSKRFAKPDLGYPSPELHFYQSLKSWEWQQKEKSKKNPKDEVEAVDGVSGRDYMENFCISTPVAIFGLLSWSKTCDSDKAKESAMVLLKGFGEHCLGSRQWTMVVDSEMQEVGVLPTTGSHIKMHGLLVLDATQLVTAFPQLGPPITRTQLVTFISVSYSL